VILIVEDDPLVASFVEQGLRAAGFVSAHTDDGGEAVARVLAGGVDLVLLDLALPGGDGFVVLSELRARGVRVPVIVVTGRVDMRGAAAALDSGADDYMTKPFDFSELLARVRARLRAGGEPRKTVLSVGSIQLDVRTRRATRAGRPLQLAAREFALLEMFMRHPDQVLSREQLLSQVWGYFFDPGTNLLSVYIGSLRKKLGSDAIETVRGAGYRLSPP
jgi:two-component system copper resistance phosphate regulon response regulator CusR